jgi:HD superfamily phosphohydrolase
MFSEVYWHHAVRSATAMFQRCVYLLRGKIEPDLLATSSERQVTELLREAAEQQSPAELLDGLFGEHRRLHKRALELSALQHADLHAALSRRPYPWLVRCSDELAARLGRLLRRSIPAHHVLLDAPPQKLEVQFNVDIYFADADQFRPLHEVSPIVHTLATDQFDRIVKRVRLLVHPDLRNELRAHPDLDVLLRDAVKSCER